MIIIQKHLEFSFKIADVPTVDNDSDVTDFTEASVTNSFNFKEKLTSQTGDNGTKNVGVTVPLKYLCNI